MNHLSISRQSEYFSLKELQLMTGMPSDWFGDVVVKELVDNAIDACEMAGIDPIINLIVYHEGNHSVIEVTDNGIGISTDLIDRLIDFSTRTSDKVARRLPSRGAQGNALKTIIGMTCALGFGYLEITSKSIQHTLQAEIIPGGDVDITVDQEPVDFSQGTRVKVVLPWLEIDDWHPRFELFNPHIRFVKNKQYEADHLASSIELNKKADFYKIKPNEPTCIHWYDFEAFYQLLFMTGRQFDQPLGMFVRQFKGLTSTGKARDIICNFDERNVSELTKDKAIKLYNAMKLASKPVKPSALGAIGKDYWQQSGCRNWYKKGGVLLEGQPYLFECMVLDNDCDDYYHGINHSPCFRDYLKDAPIAFKNRQFKGVESVREQIVFPFTLIVHLISPSINFTDRGKTSMVLPDDVNTMIGNCLSQCLKTLFSESEKVRKDAAKAERDRNNANKLINAEKPTQKEVIFQVLPDAIALATSGYQYPVNVRNLYYKVRALAQKHTQDEIDYNYFSTDVLIKYWQQKGRNKLIYNDPRGVLYEPHTGKSVPVGTFQIESYEIPEYHYDKILFIEKKGLFPTLDASKLLERFDMAVIASEGYATEAARVLLAKAAKQCTLFVLHDADPDGYNIARTLSEATKRMPDHNIKVIDLGLTIAQAVAMHLQAETMTRKKRLPDTIQFTPLELEYFEGEKSGKGKSWIAKRVELNAMSAGELIELIETGIKNNVDEIKLIPPDDTLKTQFKQSVHAITLQEVRLQLEQLLPLDGIVKQATEKINYCNDMPLQIKACFENKPDSSWRSAMSEIIQEMIDADNIRKIAADHLTSQFNN